MFYEWHGDDSAHLWWLVVALYPLRYALVRVTVNQINSKRRLKNAHAESRAARRPSVSQLNDGVQAAGTAWWVSTRLRKCSITIDLHTRLCDSQMNEVRTCPHVPRCLGQYEQQFVSFARFHR